MGKVQDKAEVDTVEITTIKSQIQDDFMSWRKED